MGIDWEEQHWSGCDLIEMDSEKVAGVPVVKGTRIPAQAIVDDYDFGSPVQEIHENFPSLPVETIEGLIAFAHSRQPVP